MDATTELLVDITLIMIIAAACSLVFTKLRLPSVVGYLVAGMLLGPAVLTGVYSFNMTTINFLADLGIVLLMFSIGLDFNLKRLRKIGSFAILAGSIEVGIMLAIGFSLGRMLQFDYIASVFLSAVIAISSTAVIIKVLTDTGKLKAEFVDPVIGILIIEDLAAVILLTLASPLINGQSPQVSTTLGILIAIGLFVGFSLILGLAVVPRIVDWVRRSFNSETLLLVALGFCFGMALLAQFLGLSVAIGAFLMGVIVGQSRSQETIVEKVTPIKEMFLAVFFVSIGMLIDPRLVINNIIPAIIIAAVFIVGKFFAVFVGSYTANLHYRTAFLSGAAMVTMGEFSFLIAKTGLDGGAVTGGFYAAVIGAALITMVFLPVSVKRSPSALESIIRRIPKRLKQSLLVIEGVRADIRGRLSASTEKRKAIRHELFWLFVDITVVVLIEFIGNVLLVFSVLIDPVAKAAGVIPSVLALVLTTALILPVIMNMVKRVRNIIRLLASSLLETRAYQTLSGTFVYRVLRRLISLFVIGILLFTLVPFAYVFSEYQSIWVLVFMAVGIVFALLLFDVFRSTYQKVSDSLAKNIIEQEGD